VGNQKQIESNGFLLHECFEFGFQICHSQ
jgi:hypothetical protein